MPKAVGLSYIFPAVPILSIIGVALLLLVLPGFWKTRNVALLSYISVCIYLNLKAFIDSLIWRNSIKNIAPIYCDITGLLTLQANIFIPAAIVCISRFIWLISTSSPYVVVHDQRRKTLIIDFGLCVGLPLLSAPLVLLCGVDRYVIIEDFGCLKGYSAEIYGVLLHRVLTLLLGVIASVYSTFAIINLVRRRATVKKYLELHPNGTSPNHYLRLVLLCIVAVILDNGFNIWFSYQVISAYSGKVVSWNTRLRLLKTVYTVPRAVIDSSSKMKISWTIQSFVAPMLAWHFFLFFGFGTEAMKEYRSLGRWLYSILHKTTRKEPEPLEHDLEQAASIQSIKEHQNESLREDYILQSPFMARSQYNTSIGESSLQNQISRSSTRVSEEDPFPHAFPPPPRNNPPAIPIQPVFPVSPVLPRIVTFPPLSMSLPPLPALSPPRPPAP